MTRRQWAVLRHRGTFEKPAFPPVVYKVHVRQLAVQQAFIRDLGGFAPPMKVNRPYAWVKVGERFDYGEAEELAAQYEPQYEVSISTVAA